jgi:hypothetical protein
MLSIRWPTPYRPVVNPSTPPPLDGDLLALVIERNVCAFRHHAQSAYLAVGDVTRRRLGCPLRVDVRHLDRWELKLLAERTE